MNLNMRTALLLTVVTTSVLVGGLLAGPWLYEEESRPAGFTFFAIGDTQGTEDLFNKLIEDANCQQPAFVLHLGDMTSSGTEEQYDRFMSSAERLEVPLYTTPGNHDIKSGGIGIYETYFGAGDYAFEHDGVLFVSVDSSLAGLSETQYSWLEEELSGDPEHKIVFTHVPPIDPREGEDHAFLDVEEGQRFLTMMRDSGVDLVLNGHIHMFRQTIRNDTMFVMSGGGGADLYEEPEKGGFHHYLEVHVSDSGMDIVPVPLNHTWHPATAHVLVRNGSCVLNLSLDGLRDLGGMQGQSAFENQYGNWKGQGTYEGVLVRDLIEQVGGMEQGDEVRVRARDGYDQRYGYFNIYPNSTVLSIQGELLLAYSFEGEEVPDWGDGFRMVFLPQDGMYSNNDALQTTDEELMGGELFSAGSRWVRNVAEIEIV